MDLDEINSRLRELHPTDIVRWALNLGKPIVTTTSFSPNSAAMLHVATQADPQMPILWIDSGYNMADCYRVAEQLIEQLSLNIKVYTPLMSSERRNALMGGIPHPADSAELFQEFVRQVKLEPFERAIRELNTEVWVTGIRREETEHRRSLDIVTRDGRGLLKVAPLFYWTAADVAAYMAEHELPSCKHYFDPTKLNDHAECGLHTAA